MPITVSEYMIQLDAVNSNGYYTLALMNRYSGNYPATITAFKTAQSLSLGRVGAHTGIGEALMLKGEPEAAVVAIQKEDPGWLMMSLPKA